MKRSNLVVSSAFLILVASSQIAWAQDSAHWSISYAPNTNLVTGSFVTYNLDPVGVALPAPIVSYTYDYSLSTCPDTWTEFTTNGTATTSAFEVVPGVYNIRCTVVYGPDCFGNTPATEKPVATITIPRPDNVVVTSGLLSPANNGDTITVIFQIKCGSLNSLDNLGLAQEKLINKVSYVDNSNGVAQNPDANFSPSAPSTKFYLNNATIVDIKKVSLSYNKWAGLAVGAIFYTATQQLQLVYYDACGDLQTLSLGSVNFRRRKVSATQWQLETY